MILPELPPPMCVHRNGYAHPAPRARVTHPGTYPVHTTCGLPVVVVWLQRKLGLRP